jgi:hypothetical protein
MLNTKRMMGWLALMWCCTSGVAMAQQSGLSGELERAGKAPPREMAAFARSATEEILGASKAISRMVDQARRDNELEEVNCLESRLSYVRALLMVTERANGAMKDAQAAGIADRSEHEFRKMAVAVSKVRQFMAEAEACLGEGGATPGTTELNVDEGAGLEEADPTEALDDSSVVVVPDPPVTSPFE